MRAPYEIRRNGDTLRVVYVASRKALVFSFYEAREGAWTLRQSFEAPLADLWEQAVQLSRADLTRLILAQCSVDFYESYRRDRQRGPSVLREQD